MDTHSEQLRAAVLVLVTNEPGADLDRAVERIAGPATVEGLPARGELEAAFAELHDAGKIERVANGGYRRVPDPDPVDVAREAGAQAARDEVAAMMSDATKPAGGAE